GDRRDGSRLVIGAWWCTESRTEVVFGGIPLGTMRCPEGSSPGGRPDLQVALEFGGRHSNAPGCRLFPRLYGVCPRRRITPGNGDTSSSRESGAPGRRFRQTAGSQVDWCEMSSVRRREL